MTKKELAKKCIAAGSKATTLAGLIRFARRGGIVIHPRRPLGTAPVRDPFFTRYRRETREHYYARRRRERIAAKAAKASYRLPRKAEAASREYLASIRRQAALGELQRIAAAVPARLRAIYGLGAIEVDLEENWPFRRASSTWAGGEHTVSITIRPNPNCAGESIRVWSDNGKWSGNNSHAELAVTPDALAFFPSLRTADGSIVLDAQPVGPREFRLTWVAQGPGFSLKPVTGWLIHGYHSTKTDIRNARKEAAAARAKQLAAVLQERASRNQLKRDYAGVFVALEDSRAAGNCESQSAAFAELAWRRIEAQGPCAVRADVVLTIRDDKFTRRAVQAAAQRGVLK